MAPRSSLNVISLSFCIEFDMEKFLNFTKSKVFKNLMSQNPHTPCIEGTDMLIFLSIDLKVFSILFAVWTGEAAAAYNRVFGPVVDQSKRVLGRKKILKHLNQRILF